MTSTRSRFSARLIAAAAIVAATVLSTATSVLAHTEFDLDEVAPGSIVSLNLFVENESSTAGTTIIELRFPEPLVIVEVPAVDGWTVAPVDGSVGGEAIGVLWSRDTAGPGEDPNLPLTIGPLPASEGRLQFKVVQTYSDGSVDRWIEDWPAGSPEPQQPGPILDLVEGAPGTVPSTTIAPTTTAPPQTTATTTELATTTLETAAASTTAAEATAPASTPDAPATTAVESSGEDSSSAGLVIAVLVLIIVAGIAAAVVVTRRRKR